jgi:putative ABC transport system ATP-binding protein
MYNISERKLYKPFNNDLTRPEFLDFLKKVLSQDKPFLVATMVYGIAISILSLATPISVQLLINSVSFTAMFQPILVLGLILLLLVSCYGLANILQFFITESFKCRFFARMGYEVGMSLLNAEHKKFEEANRAEMVNRFFETTTIQKTIPELFSKTFTVLLQSITGLILIACYHPFFLIFSLGIPLAVVLIWKIFSPKAIIHSFAESSRKHELVGWLEDISRNDLLFKSKEGREYAKFKINFLTGLYLKERKFHFSKLLKQSALLFIIYAFSTALLLILGGWLVLKSQLSLGQLVASELVVSAILYNISNLGSSFESFYDLISACEKLSQFSNIPQEKTEGQIMPKQIEEIEFNKVSYRYLKHEYHFNLNFKKGENYLLLTSGYSTRKILIEMLLGLRQALSGAVKINGSDINIFDKHELRSKIAIIDNSSFIEGTLREYLTFNRSDISDNQVMMILENLGIAELILNSESGLDLNIIPSGLPFSETEKIILKVARAIINKPQIIIADEVLDMLEPKIRKKILLHLAKENQATFLYFSHRHEGLENFDHVFSIQKTHSRKINDINEL